MADYGENEYWEMLLRFHQFKGWRVVEATDGDGYSGRCLLLPMERNGIGTTPDTKMLPFMKLKCHPTQVGVSDGKYGFFRTLFPTIPKEMHDRLVEQGLASEDEEHWSAQVGGIRKTNWRSFARGWHTAGRKKKNT